MHFRQRLARMLASALAAAVLAAVGLYAAPASAADLSATRIPVADILSQLDQLQNMQVEEDVCAKCHATYDPACELRGRDQVLARQSHHSCSAATAIRGSRTGRRGTESPR